MNDNDTGLPRIRQPGFSLNYYEKRKNLLNNWYIVNYLRSIEWQRNIVNKYTIYAL